MRVKGRFVRDICDGRHGEYGGKGIQGPEPSIRRVVVADCGLVDGAFLNDNG